MTVQEITEATLDSVVEIRTESVQMDSWMGQYVTEGAGSGVIIKENGYIITNNHVVTGASNIIVTTTDKKEYEATLVGTDPDTDVAVIKINAKGLKAATMGNSDQLNVGDLAVAIGNPLGELGGTVTAGIISALDRSISIDGKTMTLLQTDTSINPGNSGGGLFNQYGQLIGVVVAKSSGSDVEGLGFAIPINRAAEVAAQLMDGGYVKGKPSTGMAYQDMSQQQQSSDMFGFGFDEFFGGSSMQSGVYIAEINGKNAKKPVSKSAIWSTPLTDRKSTHSIHFHPSSHLTKLETK
jgi:serine protease Do